MVAKSKSDTPRIYRYIRFSTPEQSLGDSERRQLDMTKSFAKRKGIDFDETLRMFDKGRSAYHGVHRKQGVLGQFLDRVQNGQVVSGSILVVENIDRLSREGIETTLRKIIFQLWDYGIIIQTLSPEECYEPGCSNEPKFMALWIYIMRAYDESKLKSIRVKAARNTAREAARESGKILTARCPAWLEVVDDEFKKIPEAAQTVKLIFDLKRKGVGVRTITKKLNKEAAWMPPLSKNGKTGGNGWRHSYINKILRNRAVIGEYQPHKLVKEKNKKTGELEDKRKEVGEPIPKYYPRVISDELFLSVQELIKQNKGTGGRTGKATNIFRHLVKCPYCGGSMTFLDKGKPPKGRKYLVCENGRRGFKCERHSIRYDEVESLILRSCIELRPKAILPNPDKQSQRCQSLRERIQGQDAKLRDIEQQVSNLMTNLRNTKSPKMVQRYEWDIAGLDEQAEKVKTDRDADSRELSKAESSLQSFSKWKRDLKELLEAIKLKSNVELRLRLRAHLRELIDRIEIYSTGLQTTDKSDEKISWTRLTNLWGEKCERIARKKEYNDFCRYVESRCRDSKEGRFIRVHLHSGSVYNLGPAKSIPYNHTFWINKDGEIDWKRSGAHFEYLWDDFKNGK